MKQIGEHITLTEDKREALISLSVRLPRWQETLMLVWVLGWTFCGIVVLIEFFGDYTRNMKLMMLVYLCFWVYFEIQAVKGYLWKKWGTELLLIDEEGIKYKKDIRTYGKVRTYFKENISKLRPLDLKKRSFARAYFETFWTIGNQKLAFDYLGKTISFGMGITDEERDELLRQLKHQFKTRFRD